MLLKSVQPVRIIATASSATSLTATGTPFTTDAFKGWIVNAEESTNAPVWANIGSNTTSVLTVDAWKTGDDTAGTTPGATANYNVLPSTRARYMALTENAGAAAATDTVLTGELTTGGCSRALATYAHTGGAATYTAAQQIGMPEARIPLAHCAVALCLAPKSTRAYRGLNNAYAALREPGVAGLPVPLHLRNAPTRLMRDMGYGAEYKYPPNYRDGRVRQAYLPDELLGRRFLEDRDLGTEVDPDLTMEDT